jgi:hypothetical protein
MEHKANIVGSQAHQETAPQPRPFALPNVHQRRNTMIDASQIREHLEVVGSDGGHVGRVDHVVGGEIELAKLDLGGGFKHHLIPITWVDHVDDDGVHLTLTKDDAKARWREKH